MGGALKAASAASAGMWLAIIIVIALALLIIAHILHIDVPGLIIRMLSGILRLFSRLVSRSERKYHRDVEIGKLDAKRRKVRIYRFLNDLIIDLGLKRRGATPYEFLFIMIVISAFVSTVSCEIMFRSLFMAVLMFPIIFAGIMCALYTKANVAHDTRIDAVIEAENIVCNNIKDGVIVSIRSSIDVIPPTVRGDFRDFLDNVEHKNYHIRTALMELNANLGTIADDFIKKCIMFELEEEHGYVGIFKDIVEVNNIKTELRNDMKRKFEEVIAQFVAGALLIFVFLIGVIALYENVADFYFNNTVGRLILGGDALIIIGEFVYITYLRAQEL